MSFDKILLSNLLREENFTRKVLPFLKEEYFISSEERRVFSLFQAHFNQYNNLPTKKSLQVDLQRIKGIGEKEFENVVSCIKGLDSSVIENTEWLVDRTEEFCKDRAIHNALSKAIEIQADTSGNFDKGMIPELLRDALSVSFDSSVGHDYLDNAAERWEFAHKLEKRIPFDLDWFNKITKGGLVSKSLTVLLAGTGVGKSMLMAHMAAANLAAGYNVLYITMEMAEEKIAERNDANLLGISLDDLPGLKKDEFLKLVGKVKDKTSGKLIIKEYPQGTASAAHFRYLLNELKIKKNFVPDIIYVDYMNICASSRLKRGVSNSYEYVKSIAEELRSLSQEMGPPIVTATQTNRDGLDNSDISLANTSECIFVDEEIVLRDGSKKTIGDVSLGDQIISNDGFKTVSLVHHKKKKECIKITTKSGKTIIVSKDHVFPSSKGRVSVNGGLSKGDKLSSFKSPVT